MKTLKNLLKDIKYTAIYEKSVYPCGTDDILIENISYSSAAAREGCVFVCIKGASLDGHDFAEDAYRRGARVFICEKAPSLPSDAVIIVTEDTRKALAAVSAEFFSHPEKELKIIGITGTKGKSTVAYMTAHILEKSGSDVGIIGTCGVSFGGKTYPTKNTTPESYELFRILREMKDAGCKYAVMEVSSQAILLERIYGIRFALAAMTNLSPDHIGVGEHPSFDNYKECKKSLFSRCDRAVLNADDPYFDEFSSYAKCPKKTYSLRGRGDLCADSISDEKHFLGVDFELSADETAASVSIPLPGDFSVMNALCAIAAASFFGIDMKSCARALADVSVPGRFEVVSVPEKNALFVIDYAHTGESLRCALTALREYTKNRLICVFGSVGERTQLRRAELGRAANLADMCIITSDNPGTEPPENIIAEIAEHLQIPYEKIPDRELAVKRAAELAEDGDTVLFAGKGHERYQLVGKEKVPLCERELILKYSRDTVKL